jgi:hypothetical protein
MYAKHTHNGRYPVQNYDKYIGNAQQVFYRSMWELKFMKWCDQNPAVLEWGSEEIVIPYLSPVDGKIHRYFVDFFIRVRDAQGKVHRYLIEIKPKKFTEPPKPAAKKTRRHIQEVFNYAVNQAKWEQARKFCAQRDWEFRVLTERELGIDK